jgi:hypothetical protein
VEQHQQAHPLLRGALVIGNGLVQPDLLVELRQPLHEPEAKALLETLWPEIEESNSIVSGPGRIARDKAVRLNRGMDAEERQKATLSEMNKDLGPLFHELAYFQTEPESPRLGLGQDE